MAGAVGKKLSVPRLGYILSGHLVDKAGADAGEDGFSGQGIGCQDNFTDLEHFFAGLTEKKGTGDVGIIAFDLAAKVYDHHIARHEDAGAGRGVGERGALAADNGDKSQMPALGFDKLLRLSQ